MSTLCHDGLPLRMVTGLDAFAAIGKSDSCARPNSNAGSRSERKTNVRTPLDALVRYLLTTGRTLGYWGQKTIM